MKAISQFSGKTTLLCGVVAAIANFAANGQTLINLGTQGRNIDFSNAPSTRPVKTGSSLPATCVAGELFFNLAAPAGQNLYSCVATNTWVLIGFGSGLADPGSNGLVVRTAPNTTTAVAAPAGAVVGTTDAQTLTNKNIDASEVNSGVLSGSRMPAFSGDVATSAGSTATTLATVNSNPGSYGDGSHSVQLTVDAKGRITGISQVAVSGGSGSQYYQTFEQQGTTVTQRPAVDFSSAFSVSDNAGSTRTEVDLATVNATTGTFGSSTQVPVITVNGRGQITAVSTATASSGGGGGGGITSGTLASLPASCTPGALYFATDQPAGQQLYTCSSTNTWTQIVSLGPSGALAYTNGSLDIVTSVVPRLTATNNFSGLNAFSNGVQLTTAAAGQPACGSATRGLFWYQNNGASKDGLQICVYTGSAYAWTSLY
jgi:hypothetical protein